MKKFNDDDRKRMQNKRGKLRLVNQAPIDNEVLIITKVMEKYPWVKEQIQVNPEFFEMVVFIMSQTTDYAFRKISEHMVQNDKVTDNENTD